jgi:hypothetical protein
VGNDWNGDRMFDLRALDALVFGDGVWTNKDDTNLRSLWLKEFNAASCARLMGKKYHVVNAKIKELELKKPSR